MRPVFPIAALLALALVLPAPRPAAQEGEVEEAEVPSGPVMRRPPPNEEIQPAPLPPEESPAGQGAAEEGAAEDGRAVVEVLDAGVLEGVFAPYTVRDGREIPEPLTGRPGDPMRGRRLYHNFTRTGCSLCHDTAEAPREPQSDSAAPSLHRVAERLTPGRMRLWIVAPATIRPNTAMPAFHKPGQRSEVDDPLYGGPRLTADEVEDLVAYLSAAGMSKSE